MKDLPSITSVTILNFNNNDDVFSLLGCVCVCVCVWCVCGGGWMVDGGVGCGMLFIITDRQVGVWKIIEGVPSSLENEKENLKNQHRLFFRTVRTDRRRLVVLYVCRCSKTARPKISNISIHLL